MSNAQSKIRQPRFADNQWYSATAAQLQADMQNYLVDAPPPPNLPQVVGLVAPHAGHYFSGHVAGAAFATLTPHSFETVVLLGPDHRGAAPDCLSTPAVAAWRTPLGDIPVDWPMLTGLQDDLEIKLLSTDHEHSLEIELPFLQVALQEFKLVPLLLGNQSLATCRRLGEALVKAIQANGRVLLVASSDLSHFFADETARGLDETTLQFILDLDAAGLIAHIEAGRRRGEPLACGAGPIAAIIYAATTLGATQTRLLKYATSADIYPDKSSVVGYAAVLIGS
jgi:AmmeMemoRadiSam system protein B